MKRIVSILMLIILVATLLPHVPAIAQLIHTPHENPAAAGSRFDIALPILLHYNDILSLLAEGKYEGINALIEQLDLDYANIPEDIKFTMRTYNGLLSDLTEKLNSLDAALDEAELLLTESKLEETRLKLIDAGELIQEAEALLEDTDKASDELIGLLGPFAPPAEVEAMGKAKVRLREAMERLKRLEALYEASLESLETEVKQLEELPSPDITLEVDKLQAWVGDSITAWGVLSSSKEEGQPLPNRKIIILLNEEAVATATTDEDGFYQGTANIPYLYIPEMTIQANYIPEGEDKGKYQSCSSDSVDINILFHQTQLQIEAPEQAYPGLPLKIGGEITYEAGVPSVWREIKVLWDNELLETFYPSEDVFETEVIPHAQTTLGEHTLTVIVESQGHYSDASEEKTLTIIKSLPEIEVHNPAFIITPRKVRIEGKLCSELPLQGAMISVELRGVSTTVSTSADGEFEATLSLPLDPIAIGRQEVKIKVEPLEAWHLSTETKTKVFVVDIVNLGLISAAFISIGVVLYTRRRGRPRKREIEVKMPPQEPTEIALRGLEGLEGTRERVLKAYAEAMGVAENVTKVSMKPYMTLREFLKETMPNLNGAAEAFAELTHMAEGALYSPYMPGLDEAIKAENLALRVKEALR